MITHIRYSPLDNIAKSLEVYPEVALANDTALILFHLVLAISRTAQRNKKNMYNKHNILLYTWTSRWDVRVAIILLRSLTFKPTLPARSSSRRLYFFNIKEQ